MSRLHGHARGHTLIELLAVIGIVSLLAAVVTPAVAVHHARSATRSAADRFALVLRSAQAQAAAEGCRVRIVLGDDARGYEVRRQTGDGWRSVSRGEFGAAACSTNYPADAVEFSPAGWPHTVSGSARAGTFTFVCAWSSRVVVVQMGGVVRCR